MSAHGNTNTDITQTYIQALTSIRNHIHTVGQFETVLPLESRCLTSFVHDSIHIYIAVPTMLSPGPGVTKSLKHCAITRTVQGSIPGGVNGILFHVLWGRLSPLKWVPGISPRIKAAGACVWRPTTLVLPNVKKIRGFNLPGTPWATSTCCGMTFTFTQL